MRANAWFTIVKHDLLQALIRQLDTEVKGPVYLSMWPSEQFTLSEYQPTDKGRESRICVLKKVG